MKKQPNSKRMFLSIEKIRNLTAGELARAGGGLCNGDSYAGGENQCTDCTNVSVVGICKGVACGGASATYAH